MSNYQQAGKLRIISRRLMFTPRPGDDHTSIVPLSRGPHLVSGEPCQLSGEPHRFVRRAELQVAPLTTVGGCSPEKSV